MPAPTPHRTSSLAILALVGFLIGCELELARESNGLVGNENGQQLRFERR